MTIGTITQPSFRCNTISERNTILTTYPSVQDMTLCYVTDDNDLFQLEAGVWVQKFPDPSVMLAISTNSTDIATLAARPVPVQPDWNAGSGLAQILNKPTIVNNVQADWSATSGLGQILNKPAQMTAVTAVTGSTTTNVVDILGIQVATGASITTIGGTVAEIKARLNEVVARLKTVGLMAT